MFEKNPRCTGVTVLLKKLTEKMNSSMHKALLERFLTPWELNIYTQIQNMYFLFSYKFSMDPVNNISTSIIY